MECFSGLSAKQASLLEFEELNLGPVTASLVVAATGSAIGQHGTSRGIGNETDLELLKWLRSRSQIVLTSGLTARLEDYRMPLSADLAILSRQGHPRPKGNLEAKFLELGELDSYGAAIHALSERGYSLIHTEFGPSGFVELVGTGTADGVVSSMERSGVKAFAANHDFAIQRMISVAGLWIGVLEGVARSDKA